MLETWADDPPTAAVAGGQGGAKRASLDQTVNRAAAQPRQLTSLVQPKVMGHFRAPLFFSRAIFSLSAAAISRLTGTPASAFLDFK